MIDLVLARHAEPDWEPGGRAVDHPVLTERGRRQAECLARELEDQSFDAIYVSPLPRAQETAEPLLRTLGRSAETLPWLEELRLPPMQGATSDQVAKLFAEARMRPLADWWDALPGGEPVRDFHSRVSDGLDQLLLDGHGVRADGPSGYRLWGPPEADQRVLIVAHQGTNAVIFSHLLGTDPVPWDWLRFQSCHAGISRAHTVLAGGGAVWVIDAFNRVSHLDPVSLLTY